MKNLSIFFIVLIFLVFTNSMPAQWEHLLVGEHVYTVTAHGKNIFASTRNNGLLSSMDGGASWDTLGVGIVSSLFFVDSSIYAGNLNGGVYLSTNNGKDWRQLGTNLWGCVSSVAVRGTDVFACIAATNGPHYPPYGLYRININDSDWTPCKGLPANINGHCVLATEIGILVGLSTGLFFSDDGGNSWSQVRTYSPYAMINFQGTIFAAYYYGELIVSRDYSKTWSMVSGPWGLTDIDTNEAAIFVGGPGPGILCSTDMGGTWTTIAKDGLPGGIVDFAISQDNIFAVAEYFVHDPDGPGGYVNELYRKKVATALPPSGSQTPNNYLLNQNYPNPFNPSTAISYSLPKSSFVNLKVYDILGKEAAVLVNEEKAEGSYSVNFDGNKLASGTYIFRLVSGTFSQTKKMILMK